MRFINLNLLTQEDKNNLRIEVILIIIKDAFSLFFVVSAVVAILFLSSKIVLRNNYKEFVAASRLVERQNPELQQRITEINRDVGLITEMQKSWHPIEPIVREVVAAIHSPVELTNFSFDEKMRVITISGISQTRSDVLKLQKDLERLSFAQEVRSPLANILRPRDVEFVFEIRIQ